MGGLRHEKLLLDPLPSFFAAAAPHRLAVLRALWPAVTGEALANHSEIVGVQGDVVRVRADSAPWLRTLRDLRGTLIVRLQRACGPMAPRGLAFVEGPLSPGVPRRKRPERFRPPAPGKLPESIASSAARIPTDEGREAFLRAAAAFRARFGGS